MEQKIKYFNKKNMFEDLLEMYEFRAFEYNEHFLKIEDIEELKHLLLINCNWENFIGYDDEHYDEFLEFLKTININKLNNKLKGELR